MVLFVGTTSAPNATARHSRVLGPVVVEESGRHTEETSAEYSLSASATQVEERGVIGTQFGSASLVRCVNSIAFKAFTL